MPPKSLVSCPHPLYKILFIAITKIHYSLSIYAHNLFQITLLDSSFQWLQEFVESKMK